MSAVGIGLICGATGFFVIMVVAWVTQRRQPDTLPLAAEGRLAIAGCPTCGSQLAAPVRHVAWGGVIAPRLYRLVQCSGCGERYSASTGRHEKDLIRGYVRGVILAMLSIVGCAVAAWLAFA